MSSPQMDQLLTRLAEKHGISNVKVYMYTNVPPGEHYTAFHNRITDDFELRIHLLPDAGVSWEAMFARACEAMKQIQSGKGDSFHISERAAANELWVTIGRRYGTHV